jgi:hypothetical protein
MSATILVGHREDADRLRSIVDALYANDLDFFWESEGPSFAAAAQARCIVLLWTERSVTDRDMIDFADRMLAAGKAIGALVDSVALPDELAAMALFDLAGFEGSKRDLKLLELYDAAKAKAKGIAPPPKQTFFARFKRRILIANAMVIVPALYLLGNAVNIRSTFDWFSGPSREEAQALKQVTPGSCESLKVFRDRFPRGYYYQGVAHVIEHPERIVTRVPETQPFPIVLMVSQSDAEPVATREAALSDASARAQRLAQRACVPIAALDKGKVVGVSVAQRPESIGCTHLKAGMICGFTTDVTCQVSSPVEHERQVCAFKP